MKTYKTILVEKQGPAGIIKYTKRAMRMTLANEMHKDALDEGWRAILGAMADQ